MDYLWVFSSGRLCGGFLVTLPNLNHFHTIFSTDVVPHLVRHTLGLTQDSLIKLIQQFSGMTLGLEEVPVTYFLVTPVLPSFGVRTCYSSGHSWLLSASNIQPLKITHIHLATTSDKFSLCDLSGITQVTCDTNMDRTQLPRTSARSREIVLSLSCGLLCRRASFHQRATPTAPRRLGKNSIELFHWRLLEFCPQGS